MADQNLNTNIFKQIDNEIDSRFNDKEGLQPLAFKMFASTNRDIGNFKYTITARTSKVNVLTIFFNLELEIEILECFTTSVSAP